MKVTSELLDKAEQQPDAHEPWLRYRLSAFGKALAEQVLEGILPKEPSLINRMGKMFSKGTRVRDEAAGINCRPPND